MAKQTSETVPAVSGTIRVRVKPGATIAMGYDAVMMRRIVATGGEWIDVAPIEMRNPAFRSNVETSEDITAAALEDAKTNKTASTGSELFNSLKTAMISQHKSSITERLAIEGKEAEAKIKYAEDLKTAGKDGPRR